MAKTRPTKLLLQRLTAIGLTVAAVFFIVQFATDVSRQNGLLVYGLDKSIGAIKPGDRFDRSVMFCNLTAQTVNVSVIHACSCAGVKGLRRRIAPFTAGVIHMPYHIVDREKGKHTQEAICKCAFSNGKEVFYMVKTGYAVK